MECATGASGRAGLKQEAEEGGLASPLARALLDELAADPEALRELACALEDYLPRPAAQEDRWLSTREAALYLGLSVTALHRLTAAREVPFEQERARGKCWFLRSELHSWRRTGMPSRKHA